MVTLHHNLLSAAIACAIRPSPFAIRLTSGAIFEDASGVILWLVHTFRNVPTQAPPVYLAALTVGSV